jgi:SPW repeat
MNRVKQHEETAMSMYSPPHQTSRDLRAGVRLASGLNTIAGAWLFVSAWVLGYADDRAALANALIVGAVIVVLAGIRFAGTDDLAASWVNLVAGGWTFFSAWILGFGDRPDAVWNNVIVGVAVVVLALISASATTLESRVVR